MVIPIIHQIYLKELIENLKKDSRFDSLLICGSAITDDMDDHSDLDLTLVSNNLNSYNSVMLNRVEFAQQMEGYLSGFTGEHVGEPRLLITLYQRGEQLNKLLHVDLKFITLNSIVSSDQLIERPIVLWDRENTNTSTDNINNLILSKIINWPNKTPDWFEERAWIWLHYCLTKIQRGELFEAIGMVTYFREHVLGPLIFRRNNLNQRGVRKIELVLQNQQSSQSNDIRNLESTVPQSIDKQSLLISLNNCINLYLNLRNDDKPQNIVKNMPEILLRMMND